MRRAPRSQKGSQGNADTVAGSSSGRRCPIAPVPLAALCLLAGAVPAAGQVLNYRHYTPVDGLPQTQVNAIHQDRDGFIWFGTYGGLTRYNGRDFRTYAQDDGLAGNAVHSIREDRNGRLIVAMGSAICVRSNQSTHCVGRAEGLRGDARDALPAGADSIWVATSRGVALVIGTAVTYFDRTSGLPSDEIHRLERDPTGQLWVATERGLARFENNRFVAEHTDVIGNETIRVLRYGPPGLVIGTTNGLYIRTGDGLRRIAAANGDVYKDADFDAAGSLWIGTMDGVLNWNGSELVRLTTRNGLLFDQINRVMTDREGNIWFGTELGASKLVPGPFAHFTDDHGLPNPFVRALARDSAGRIWLGTRDGIAVHKDGEFHAFDFSGVPDPRVYSLAPLRDGRTLVGTRRGLVLFDGRVRAVLLSADGLPHDYVLSLLPAPDGGVWVGTSRGLAYWKDGRIQSVDSPMLRNMGVIAMAHDGNGRLWLGGRDGRVIAWDGHNANVIAETGNTIWSIARDRDNRMWIGTNGGGVLRVENGTIRMLTTDDGLVDNFVWQVFADSHGMIWLYTNRGLDCFDGTEFIHYGREEGLVNLEGSANAAVEDTLGNLWFGTGTGVTRFEPTASRRGPVPPPIYVEAMTTDRGPVGVQQRIRTSDGPVRISFASPTFRSEGAIRFRYRLIGAGDTWSPPTSDNSISYGALSPGRYLFQVEAVDEHGRSSREPAVRAFTILPAFYQTWWFRSVCAFVLLGLAAVIWVARSRLHEAERRRLETLVAERTQEIAQKSERLEREIAERGQVEEQLRQAQKMEAVGRLAGGIAHDFNNLLTSVVGHTELIATELPASSSLRTELAEIRRAADRATSLVTQLLAFSRKQVIKQRLLDMNAVASESIRMLRRLIGSDIEVTLETSPSPAIVYADPAQLDQILINLVVNARDAMPTGGRITIRIGTDYLTNPIDAEHETFMPGKFVSLCVSDTGQGMDAETRSRVFEPFFTTKEVGKGSGLGLSTVYGIVKQNGGAIRLDSEPGAGARFCVYLPASASALVAAETAPEPVAPGTGRDQVVLVVEDEPAVRHLVCRTLRRSGYHVLEAADGPAAVAIASSRAEPIHLLLSDMIMPGMNGRMVAERITELRHETRVLFMSGHTADALGIRGVLDDSTQLLTKPFTPSELTSRVQALLS